MNKLFTYTTRVASLLRGLLLFSIMILTSLGVTAQNEVTVTNAADLKTKLEETTAFTIHVTESFEFEKWTNLGASHTLNIDDGQTITCNNGGFDIGDNTFTIGDAGTLICNRPGTANMISSDAGGKLILSGTVKVKITKPDTGSATGGINVLTVDVESGASIELDAPTASSLLAFTTLTISGTIGINRFDAEAIKIGLNQTMTIQSGGRVTVKKGNSGSGIVVDGTLSLEDGGTLNGDTGGSISLTAGATLQGMNGKLEDQGCVLESNSVTVGEKEAVPSVTGLSAGIYTWTTDRFAKTNENEGWSLTDGTLTISSDIGMVNWINYSTKNPDVKSVQIVTIEDAVTEIVNMAFLGCQMDQVNIGEGVKKIGARAFASTSNLKELSIPASVTEIGEDAFLGSGIEKFDVASDNSTFKTDDSKKVLLTYDGKTLVAYAPAPSLTGSYSIPDGVTTLGTFCFKRRQLSSVEIPASVTTIEPGAFREAPNLKSVTFKGTKAPTIGENAFYECPDDLKLYVPAGSTESYKTALNTNPDNSYLIDKIHTVSVELTIHNDNTGKLGDKGFWITYEGNKYNSANQFPLSVEAGKTVSITSSCYELEGVKYGDQDATQGSSASEYTFTMPDTPTTIRIDIFNAKKFKIVYRDASGVQLDNLSPSTFTIESSFPIDLPEKVEKKGYKFLGWKADEGALDYTTQIPAFEAQDLTFYADFESLTITSLRTDTLKNLALETLPSDDSEVINTLKSLYSTLTAILADNKTIKVALTWSLTTPPFSSDSKATQEFTWSASLPAGYMWNDGVKQTGTITVTNPTVVEDNLITMKDGEVLIGRDKVAASEVTVLESNVNCTLKEVNTRKTTIPSGNLSTTFNLKGRNQLGDFSSKGEQTVLQLESGAELSVTSFSVISGQTTIQSDKNGPIPSLSNVEPQIEKGSLTDNTGSIKKVLSIDKQVLIHLTQEPGNQTVAPSASATISLKITIADGYSLTPILQKWNENKWEDQPISRSLPSNNQPALRSSDKKSVEMTIPTTGIYRIRIKAEKTDGGNLVIILHSHIFEVKNSDPNPPYKPPTFYNVTLPSVAGVQTDPRAGEYSVEEYTDFSFQLTLDKEYDQSVPVVTTDGGEILEPFSEGVYILKSIHSDVAISINGIVKNPSLVANAEIKSDSRIVFVCRDGILCITIDRPLHVQVICLNGRLLYSQDLPAGETRLDGLPDGIYIVRLSDGTTGKVVIY